MYYIYYYKSPSGSYYIGITNNLDRRKQEHRKKGNNECSTKFAAAIRKYGFDNLEYGVLETVDSEESAKEREIYYIEFYDSYKNGYNSTLGGDLAPTRRKLTDEEIIEIKELIHNSKKLLQDIAKRYSISPSIISDIKNNKRWSYIGEKVERKENWFNKGSDNPESKLTEELVREIKIKLSKGITRKQLVEEYGVSKTNIQMIATGESWGHVVVEQYKYKKVRNGNAKLDEDKVRDIWKDRKDGLTQKQLYEKYEVSRSTIQNLLKGKIWKDIYEEMN